jgi:hypothetical protein
MSTTRATSALALAVWLGLAALGHADRRPGDAAAAEAAFREGRHLLGAGQVAAACAQFETSQRLDPASGTQINLADCYSRLGRTASAWAAFVAVADRDGKSARGAEARRRAAALEPRLSRLVITAAGAPPDLRVTRDGAEVTPLVGVAVPTDPGRHTLAASAAGRSWSDEATVDQPGATVTVAIPAFWRTVVEPPPVPRPVMLAPPPPPAPSSTQKTVALVLGGAGVGAVVVGVVFGAMARSDWNDSRAHCDAMNFCDDAGFDEVESAQRSAGVATVLVGSGLVAIAAGGVLWLTAPRASDRVTVAPAVAPGRVGWTLSGRF